MKHLASLIIFLLILFFANVCIAQTGTDPKGRAADVVSEDEHLPFMTQEQTTGSQEPGSGSLLYKTLGSMLLIVGLIFAGAWGAKKLGFGNKIDPSSAALELATISSLSLGNGRIISAIQFGSRILLVGSTAGSFTLLAEEVEDQTIQVARSRSVADMLAEENGSFADKFDQAQKEFSL